MNPPFILESRNGHRLEIRHRDLNWATVEVQCPGLTAKTDLWTYAAGALDSFFVDIAHNWRGWDGTKTWSPYESSISMEATVDRSGHVFLTVRFHADSGAPWTAAVPFLLEAGQLDGIAADACAYSDRTAEQAGAHTYPAVPDVAAGLQLASAALLLPWDARFTELQQMGLPRVTEHTEESAHGRRRAITTVLAWEGDTVLHGIPADVQVRSDECNIFHLIVRDAERFGYADGVFQHLRGQLVERFGPPWFSETDEHGRSSLRWHVGSVIVQVSAADQITESIDFIVRRRPVSLDPDSAAP